MVVEGKSIYVSLAHRYWNAGWDLERNRAVYGRDVSSQGLGANLELKAFVSNPGLEPITELTTGLEELKKSVDHRSLFDDFPQFRERPSTLEAIAQYLGGELFKRPLPVGQWNSFQVWETESLGAIVWPGCETVQLKLRARNLWLTLQGRVDADSGLLIARNQIENAVEKAYAQLGDQPRSDLGRWLFSTLTKDLPDLAEVRVDLARHKFLTVGRQDLIVSPIAP